MIPYGIGSPFIRQSINYYSENLGTSIPFLIATAVSNADNVANVQQLPHIP